MAELVYAQDSESCPARVESSNLFVPTSAIIEICTLSSVGRATPLHGEGRRSESYRVHKTIRVKLPLYTHMLPDKEQIILVDENDIQVGAMEKLKTHEKGLLHRAFSIFVRNDKGECMLQKRALGKYHSGGLWSNTCCGHPRDGEDLESAAHRRLNEEMGLDCPLREVFTLTYQANLDHGLKENEFLHVLVGAYDNGPVLNPEEADDWKWIPEDELKKDIAKNPNNYTQWFGIILKKAEEKNIALT